MLGSAGSTRPRPRSLRRRHRAEKNSRDALDDVTRLCVGELRMDRQRQRLPRRALALRERAGAVARGTRSTPAGASAPGSRPRCRRPRLSGCACSSSRRGDADHVLVEDVPIGHDAQAARRAPRRAPTSARPRRTADRSARAFRWRAAVQASRCGSFAETTAAWRRRAGSCRRPSCGSTSAWRRAPRRHAQLLGARRRRWSRPCRRRRPRRGSSTGRTRSSRSARSSRRAALVLGADRLRRVLDHDQVVRVRDRHHGVHVGHLAVEMHRDDRAGPARHLRRDLRRRRGCR